jgi:hypothetical protein
MRLKTILALVLAGVACYAGSKVIPPYYANAQLADKMREEARFARAEDRSADQLRNIIFREAQNQDIALRSEDIQIETSPSGVLITADYDATVDLPFTQLSLHFHPSSDR